MKGLPLPLPLPLSPHSLLPPLLLPLPFLSSPLLLLSPSLSPPLSLTFSPHSQLSSEPPTSGPLVPNSTFTTRKRPCCKSLVEVRPHWLDRSSPPGLAVTQTPSEQEIKALHSGRDIKGGKGETFQKQAFLTFVQTLGTFCFEKSLIHTMALGLRTRVHRLSKCQR